MAMALAAIAAADSASAAARKNAWHSQQASIGKGVAGGSLTSKKPISLRATRPTTQGIIMRDGGVCDPIRHMGC
jgi:hypothetical protein